MKCLICSNQISPFINFGKMPIANGFLKESEFSEEYFYELAVAFCNSCYMVQLTEQPDRKLMFHENYAFYSSTSKAMAAHFEVWAKDVMDKYKPEFVVEIGSNDGIMLRHFTCERLGIEPSWNVAQVATGKGIETLCYFFDDKVADVIVDKYKQADVILAANVMCHISDIHSVIKGVKKLLKPEGVLIFEDPYLGDILEKVSYDQIYDEHAFYFSVTSLSNLFAMHNMEIIDVEHQDTHGGSMRYTVANKGVHKQSLRHFQATIEESHRYGIKLPETYEKFEFAVKTSKINLAYLLQTLRFQGKRVVGYGATSKSTTVLNYCGITPDLLEFICDTTPIKQYKFSPGMHIPIVPHEVFSCDGTEYPDYALLFAWNHAKEIMAKEKFTGRWFTYVDGII